MNTEEKNEISAKKSLYDKALQNIEISAFSKSSLNRKYEKIYEYEIAENIPCDMYLIKLIFKIKEFKELEYHFLERLKNEKHKIKVLVSRDLWDRLPNDMETWETETTKIPKEKSNILRNINEKYDEVEHQNFLRYQKLLLENIELKNKLKE